MSNTIKHPREADEYRRDIIKYGERSYTRTIFHGFIYRFLVELLKHDETELSRKFPDLDSHILAHLSNFRVDDRPHCHTSSRYSYSELPNLLENPLPDKHTGQLLFLGGHLPGSWIAAIGAKYDIAPEFFRRHIHLWRTSHGAVLYAIPTLPSVNSRPGIALRLITCGDSVRSFDNLSLASRRRMLPEKYFHNPTILTPAPGSTYIRSHAFLDNTKFLIEQDISITIQSNGHGWTAILWSDVGSRDLSHSQDFHWFLSDLQACSKTGHRWIRLSPTAVLGIDSQLHHSLPDLSLCPDEGDSLTQAAAHLPREFHLTIDHAIAAIDPLYALSPIFLFAASEVNSFLDRIQRRYEIIAGSLWDPAHSKEAMEELILYKHLLDDNAARHEQVLRFLQTPDLAAWANRLDVHQRLVADKAKNSVKVDFEYLSSRCRQLSSHHQEAISILTSATALMESRKQITLATQVTKLTILASVFLPLSFCTGIFGMNFIELESLRIWIWGVVTLVIGVVTLVVYGWDERKVWQEKLKKLFVGKSGVARWPAQ